MIPVDANRKIGRNPPTAPVLCSLIPGQRLDTDAGEDEIIAFCRQNLAGFKVPRKVVFGPLPKTATGKIQKFVLRQRAIELK